MLKTRSFTPPAKSAAGSSAAKRAGRLASLPLSTRILGLDPGLHRTGYGILTLENASDGGMRFDQPHLLEAGVLRARAKDELPERLGDLHASLTEVLTEHRPEVVVIEDLFSTYAHPRSALLMAHARGALMLAAHQAGIPVHSFTPNEVKQVVTGNGHAAKSTVQAAVRARLRLSAPLEPADVADALAIALCFALRQDMAGKLG